MVNESTDAARQPAKLAKHRDQRADRYGQPRARAARKRVFLEALEANGGLNITQAADTAGIRRQQVYEWRADDSDFAERLQRVIDKAIDQIEETARKLANGELTKPVVSAGKLVTEERVYDSRIIELMLRSHRPDRYQEEKRVLVKHESQVLQQVLAWMDEALSFAGITPEQRSRIAEYVRQRPIGQLASNTPQLTE